VARQLRQSRWHEAGCGAIVMVSANAADLQRAPAANDVHHGQLVKPIVVTALLNTIGRLLGLEWTADPPCLAGDAPDPRSYPAAELPAPHRIEELRQLGHIGYVRGIHAKLDQIETESPTAVAFVSRMRALVQGLEMHRYMSVLEAVGHHDP
jgi:hypothetical protein